jgi:hypothetical protein
MSKTSLLNGSVFAIVLPLALAVATGTALADCKSSYVWRDAKDGDGVCVAPQERAEAKAQNANAGRLAADRTAQTPAVTDTFGGRRLPATSFACPRLSSKRPLIKTRRAQATPIEDRQGAYWRTTEFTYRRATRRGAV